MISSFNLCGIELQRTTTVLFIYLFLTLFGLLNVQKQTKMPITAYQNRIDITKCFHPYIINRFVEESQIKVTLLNREKYFFLNFLKILKHKLKYLAVSFFPAIHQWINSQTVAALDWNVGGRELDVRCSAWQWDFHLLILQQFVLSNICNTIRSWQCYCGFLTT